MNKKIILFVASIIVWWIFYAVLSNSSPTEKKEIEKEITPLSVTSGAVSPLKDIDIFEWRFSWFTWSVGTLSAIKWTIVNWKYSYEIWNNQFKFDSYHSDIFNKTKISWSWNILDKLSYVSKDNKYFSNLKMSSDNIKDFNSMVSLLESSTSSFSRLNYWIDNSELKNKSLPWILFLAQNLIYIQDSDYYKNYKSLFTVCSKLTKWSDYAIYIWNQCLADLYISANSKLVTENPDANEMYKVAMVLLSDDYSFIDQIRNSLISNWGFPIDNIKNGMMDSYIYGDWSIKIDKMDLTQLKISLNKFEKTIWNSEMQTKNKKFIDIARLEIFWNNEDMKNTLIRKIIQYYSNQQK